MEYYGNNGALKAVIEGLNAAEVYYPAIDKGWISKHDHAAYLGRELARAEHALKSDEPYVQDAAPEKQSTSHASISCGCASTSKEVCK